MCPRSQLYQLSLSAEPWAPGLCCAGVQSLAVSPLLGASAPAFRAARCLLPPRAAFERRVAKLWGQMRSRNSKTIRITPSRTLGSAGFSGLSRGPEALRCVAWGARGRHVVLVIADSAFPLAAASNFRFLLSFGELIFGK